MTLVPAGRLLLRWLLLSVLFLLFLFLQVFLLLFLAVYAPIYIFFLDLGLGVLLVGLSLLAGSLEGEAVEVVLLAVLLVFEVLLVLLGHGHADLEVPALALLLLAVAHHLN